MKKESLITAVRHGGCISILVNGIYTLPVIYIKNSSKEEFEPEIFQEGYNGFYVSQDFIDNINNELQVKYLTPESIPTTNFWPYAQIVHGPLYNGVFDSNYIAQYLDEHNIAFDYSLSSDIYWDGSNPYFFNVTTGEGLLLETDNGYITSVHNITVLYRLIVGFEQTHQSQTDFLQQEIDYIINNTELSFVNSPYYSSPVIICNLMGEYPRRRNTLIYLDSYGFIDDVLYDVQRD